MIYMMNSLLHPVIVHLNKLYCKLPNFSTGSQVDPGPSWHPGRYNSAGAQVVCFALVGGKLPWETHWK